jgi:hypothetical protein
LTGEKANVEKSTAIKTMKLTRLKLLLLFHSLQPQFCQPADGFEILHLASMTLPLPSQDVHLTG